ncbi:MAG TPA: hypothetical protein PKL52_10150 [Tenuifilaceae bacterium]|nr:hypothetical protein [Tenuifilaceae bacterium]
MEKAKRVVEDHSKQRKLKFIKAREKGGELNEVLIEKTRRLLGVEGYYMSLKEEDVNSVTIISHHQELHRIEQAFRVSKSDLETRPIYHFKEQPIKLHTLICFMALAVSKHIELRTGVSIKRFKGETKKVTDGHILKSITRKTITLEAKSPEKLKHLVEKIFPPH